VVRAKKLEVGTDTSDLIRDKLWLGIDVRKTVNGDDCHLSLWWETGVRTYNVPIIDSLVRVAKHLRQIDYTVHHLIRFRPKITLISGNNAS